MKKIHLNGPAADNAGNFCDGGAELDVSNSQKSGHIDEERAKQLVGSGGATVVPVAAKAASAKKAPARKRAAKKPPATPAPSAPAPAPAPAPSEPTRPE